MLYITEIVLACTIIHQFKMLVISGNLSWNDNIYAGCLRKISPLINSKISLNILFLAKQIMFFKRVVIIQLLNEFDKIEQTK